MIKFINVIGNIVLPYSALEYCDLKDYDHLTQSITVMNYPTEFDPTQPWVNSADGHFVNFSYMNFQAKMSCRPKLTELVHLC